MSEVKPKIKMTKTLPVESGWYYFAESPTHAIGFNYVFMYASGAKVAHNGDLLYCKDIGGYWAVAKSMFEFEGE